MCSIGITFEYQRIEQIREEDAYNMAYTLETVLAEKE